MVQWHQVFTTEAQVQSLIRELDPCKLCSMAKNNKGQLREEKQSRSFRTSAIYSMPTTQKRGGRKAQSAVHSFTPPCSWGIPVQGVVVTFVTVNGWGGWTKEFGRWTMKFKCWGSGKPMVPHTKQSCKGKFLMKRKLLNTYPLKYKQIAQVNIFIGVKHVASSLCSWMTSNRKNSL